MRRSIGWLACWTGAATRCTSPAGWCAPLPKTSATPTPERSPSRSTQTRLGSPEGELAIAQAAVYLACAAKSNAVYKAFGTAMRDASELGSLEVPLHLRNAPTALMKKLGYARRYRYAHEEPEAYAAGEHYFPDGVEARRYYSPVARGLEIRIAERLSRLRELDRQHREKQEPGSHGPGGD